MHVQVCFCSVMNMSSLCGIFTSVHNVQFSNIYQFPMLVDSFITNSQAIYLNHNCKYWLPTEFKIVKKCASLSKMYNIAMVAVCASYVQYMCCLYLHYMETIQCGDSCRDKKRFYLMCKLHHTHIHAYTHTRTHTHMHLVKLPVAVWNTTQWISTHAPTGPCIRLWNMYYMSTYFSTS